MLRELPQPGAGMNIPVLVANDTATGVLETGSHSIIRNRVIKRDRI
jgi:hypothetical protein